jgi:hypothetical protein
MTTSSNKDTEVFKPYRVCLIVDIPGLGKANDIVLAENSPNGRVNLLNDYGRIAKTNAIKGTHYLKI